MSLLYECVGQIINSNVGRTQKNSCTKSYPLSNSAKKKKSKKGEDSKGDENSVQFRTRAEATPRKLGIDSVDQKRGSKLLFILSLFFGPRSPLFGLSDVPVPALPRWSPF